MIDARKNAVSLEDIVKTEEDRIVTDIGGFDRVAGGGLVRGSLLLLGGDPGTGKSTLLMQISDSIAQQGGKVLYVSGEENVGQIKMRATRLDINARNIYLVGDSDVGVIYQCIEDIKPDLLIVDSIQTVTNSDSKNAMGGVNQIKDAIHHLMQISKGNGLTTIVVGQVNKDGTIAGPKILEHMVDVILYLKGERDETFRQLVAIKNRFGSTQERGDFEMSTSGLIEHAFSSRREKKKKGWLGKLCQVMFIFWVIGTFAYLTGM
jgi:DNA repair protein RadA/Sms